MRRSSSASSSGVQEAKSFRRKISTRLYRTTGWGWSCPASVTPTSAASSRSATNASALCVRWRVGTGMARPR